MKVHVSFPDNCTMSEVGYWLRVPGTSRLLWANGPVSSWVWLTEFNIISFRNPQIYDEVWKLI